MYPIWDIYNPQHNQIIDESKKKEDTKPEENQEEEELNEVVNDEDKDVEIQQRVHNESDTNSGEDMNE